MCATPNTGMDGTLVWSLGTQYDDIRGFPRSVVYTVDEGYEYISVYHIDTHTVTHEIVHTHTHTKYPKNKRLLIQFTAKNYFNADMWTNIMIKMSVDGVSTDCDFWINYDDFLEVTDLTGVYYIENHTIDLYDITDTFYFIDTTSDMTTDTSVDLSQSDVSDSSTCVTGELFQTKYSRRCTHTKTRLFVLSLCCLGLCVCVSVMTQNCILT